MSNVWKHFITITRHRLLVRKHCFKVGLYWQGLTHDLSKYSPSEFRVGVRYYQGNRSPNTAQRELLGYSTAWMHHKGRNRHHFEYWTDINLATRHYEPVDMPTKYFVEMVMDRIAACKVYKGKDYQDGDALQYLNRSKGDKNNMHPETRRKLETVLGILAEQGEAEMFRFVRQTVLQGKPF
ncbi:MAG: catalase [Ruminococcaceae bacterium]|nr:catalase [Oscillospiraceae bacterium]